jgi:hypothetical protein
VGQDNLKVYITKYYNTLFGDLAPLHFTLDEEINHDLPQLSTAENDIHTTTFTREEGSSGHF